MFWTVFALDWMNDWKHKLKKYQIMVRLRRILFWTIKKWDP